MAMTKKRTMRMKKRYNTKSRKGGIGFFNRVQPYDPYQAVNNISETDVNNFGTTYSPPLDEEPLLNQDKKFQSWTPQGECDPTNLPNIKGAWELKNNYDKCCPPKKGWFGNKKNDSAYCTKLDSKYTSARQDNRAEAKELQGAVNYQGYAPPKKKWFGLFGGRRTKRRRSQKKRTTRRRKY